MPRVEFDSDAIGKRSLRLTAAITIIEQMSVSLDAREQARVAALARDLASAEPALRSTEPFGSEVASGCLSAPSVVIEDHSAIALFEEAGDLAYGYRALLLAGDGDLAIIGIPRNETFESYCRDLLGLGHVDILITETGHPNHALAVGAARDRALVARLAAEARQAHGLNLVPYMGTGGIWELAARIAAEAERPVRVAAPRPRLVRRVNDKSWFADRVSEVLGPRAAPPTVMAYGFAALAAQIAGFARRFPSVAVKLTDSASSAGNLVLDSAEMARSSLRRIAEALRERLQGLGWRGTFPLVVTAWERPVLASPSVQLWVPDRAEGPPIVEGIFDQTVMGSAAVFIGAAPTALPMPWQARAAGEAVRLATLFQALGYFGRCSFDSVLVGQDEQHAELHWVECNGRWGGVSIPMTLTNRLTGDWTLMPPVIIERAGLCGRPRPLREILAELRDELYQPATRPKGLVVLSPGRLEQGSGYEAMALDTSVDAGRARAQRLEQRLLQAMGVLEGQGATA